MWINHQQGSAKSQVWSWACATRKLSLKPWALEQLNPSVLVLPWGIYLPAILFPLHTSHTRFCNPHPPTPADYAAYCYSWRWLLLFLLLLLLTAAPSTIPSLFISSSWGYDLLVMNTKGIVDGAASAAAGTGAGNAASRQACTSTPTSTFTPIVGLPPWHSLFVCWWGITEFGTEMAFSPLFNVGVVLKPA